MASGAHFLLGGKIIVYRTERTILCKNMLSLHDTHPLVMDFPIQPCLSAPQVDIPPRIVPLPPTRHAQLPGHRSRLLDGVGQLRSLLISLASTRSETTCIHTGQERYPRLLDEG